MSQQLEAIGGTPPYTWIALDALPTGLALNSAGVLTGTATNATAGSFYMVQVTDATATTAAVELWLEVVAIAAPVPPVAEVLRRVAGLVVEMQTFIQAPAFTLFDVVPELEVTIRVVTTLAVAAAIVPEMMVTIANVPALVATAAIVPEMAVSVADQIIPVEVSIVPELMVTIEDLISAAAIAAIVPEMLVAIATSSMLPVPTSYWNLQSNGNDSIGSLNFTNNGVVFGSGYAAFDGGDDLTQNDAAALQLGNGDWTITCWVYLDSISNYTGILVKGTGSSREYEIFGDPFDGGFYLSAYDTSSGAVVARVNGGSAPTTGEWHFLCAKHSAADSTISLSRNNGTFINAGCNTIRTTTEVLTLGNRNGTSFRLNGRMRFMGFFKGTLLGEADITYLYNSGNGRAYPFV